MALETRKGGGVYYYRAKREGGHVRKRYVAAGYVATLASQLDALERQEAAEVRQAIEADLRHYKAIAQLLTDFCSATDTLVTAWLLVNGYHSHKGTWRKVRHAQS